MSGVNCRVYCSLLLLLISTLSFGKSVNTYYVSGPSHRRPWQESRWDGGGWHNSGTGQGRDQSQLKDWRQECEERGQGAWALEAGAGLWASRERPPLGIAHWKSQEWKSELLRKLEEPTKHQDSLLHLQIRGPGGGAWEHRFLISSQLMLTCHPGGTRLSGSSGHCCTFWPVLVLFSLGHKNNTSPGVP